MADIRKRVGEKGTTYQVRYLTNTTKTGYAFKFFNTMKEASAFTENLGSFREGLVLDSSIKTVPEAIDKWLKICEKEGTDGNEPVTKYTIGTYEYFSEFMLGYAWNKELRELQTPDIVEFRSWLLTNCPSRYVARKTLTYFHTVLNEMALRGHIAGNVASGISISSTSRYEQPVTPLTLGEFHALLAAADRLANSKNRQIAKAWERYRPMLYLAGDTGMRPSESSLTKVHLTPCASDTSSATAGVLAVTSRRLR